MMLSCNVDKACSVDEVVHVEVVFWMWWVEIVKMKRIVRVRCVKLRPVYLYPCHRLKYHSLASLILLVCSLVAMALAQHGLCTLSLRVSCANRFDSL